MPVVTVERSRRYVVIKLGSVGGELRLKPVKHLFGEPAWISRRLHHQWRHRADDRRFCNPAFAVAGNVVHYFASAGRVADMHRFLKVEMCGQRRQVVSIMIHVMAATGLGGTAMSAPVVGYDAITLVEEEQHLRVPIIRRKRPAMAKHDGLPFAPILVINLRSVFRHDRAHVAPPLVILVNAWPLSAIRANDPFSPWFTCLGNILLRKYCTGHAASLG